MSDKDKLLKIQEKLKYMFINENYLKIALTHKSYAYEKKMFDPRQYNERIEYLGDAILEHIISELLFFYRPTLSEGEMTKKRANIVCEKTLANVVRSVGGDKYIYVGKCEKVGNEPINDAILCDLFESILGAIYIDGGYEVAKSVCLNLLDKYIKAELQGNELVNDYKTKLQEELQVNGNVKIEYILKEEKGPDHNKTFIINVLFNNKKIGEGCGKNKKQAEQQAAKYALENKTYL